MNKTGKIKKFIVFLRIQKYWFQNSQPVISCEIQYWKLRKYFINSTVQKVKYRDFFKILLKICLDLVKIQQADGSENVRIKRVTSPD